MTDHIYIGAKFENNVSVNLLKCKYNVKLASILKKYQAKIVVEVSGHDHVADLRYNLGGDFDSNCQVNSKPGFIQESLSL